MIIKKIPRQFRGHISVPASKSIANRLLILREISGRKLKIKNLSNAQDTITLASVLDELSSSQDLIFTIDIGNCGTCIRFLTSYLATRPGTYILTGNERMQNRPIGPLVDALRRLGAQIAFINKENYPPLFITGLTLEGGKTTIDCTQSSQFASSILLIAPALVKGVELSVKGLNSASYLSMTTKIMEQIGVRVEQRDTHTFFIPRQQIVEQTYTIPADWSSATFWYAFVALAEEASIIIKDLKYCGLQGDSILYKIYNQLGVQTTFSREGAHLMHTGQQTDFFEMDMNSYPDLAIPLIVNLVLLGVSFKLSGLAHLRYKESDRLSALKNELQKIGAHLNTTDQGEVSWTREELKFPDNLVFNTYDDHRLAMALAQVAMFANIELVDGENVVNKSYPDFWVNFKKLFKTKTE